MQSSLFQRIRMTLVQNEWKHLSKLQKEDHVLWGFFSTVSLLGVTTLGVYNAKEKNFLSDYPALLHGSLSVVGSGVLGLWVTSLAGIVGPVITLSTGGIALAYTGAYGISKRLLKNR